MNYAQEKSSGSSGGSVYAGESSDANVERREKQLVLRFLNLFNN